MTESKLSWRLSDLIPSIPDVLYNTDQDADVTGIRLDSRQVKPGDLFVALEGAHHDGHQFIEDAIRLGATGVIGTKEPPDLPVPYVQVEDGRNALAHLTAAFYGHPARQLTVIGVTGTDGKTTTSNLIYHILRAAGVKTGMVTTVNALIGDDVFDTGFHVTTPEAADVQNYLSRMVDAGLTHVILEATSHGLAQRRVAACEFDIGVVTNITHEHLDYHGSHDVYQQAKGMLFSDLQRRPQKSNVIDPAAVLNRDDTSYPYLSSLLGEAVRRITYGLKPVTTLWAEEVVESMDGLSFYAASGDMRFPIQSSLRGAYNVENCLAAIGCTLFGLGVGVEAVQRGIAELEEIPGRMEVFDLGQEFGAIVDFAHTPNALRESLNSARSILEEENTNRRSPGSGRIIAVFGSAGLRDREKRRLMAEISAELADITILTAEDPRTESLNRILAEMASGAEAKGGTEGKTFWRVPDRGEAIRFGLALARPEDLVIALGKGHEQSMCFGEIEYAWDDRTAMKAALAEYLGIEGPTMPYLPTSDGNWD